MSSNLKKRVQLAYLLYSDALEYHDLLIIVDHTKTLLSAVFV